MFFTLYCTPYGALLPELGHTPSLRLQLSTMLAVTFGLGSLAGAGAATMGRPFGLGPVGTVQVCIWLALAWSAVRAMALVLSRLTRVGRISACVCLTTSLYTALAQVGALMVCFLACVCMYVPVLTISEAKYCAPSAGCSAGPVAALRSCLANGHFRTFTSAEFAFSFSNTLIMTGMPYYLETLLNVSASDWLLPTIGTFIALAFVVRDY